MSEVVEVKLRRPRVNNVRMTGKFIGGKPCAWDSQTMYTFLAVRKDSETVDYIPMVVDGVLEQNIEMDKIYDIVGQLRSHDVYGVYVTLTDIQDSDMTDLYCNYAKVHIHKVFRDYGDYDTVERKECNILEMDRVKGVRSSYRIKFGHPVYNRAYYCRMVVWDGLALAWRNAGEQQDFVVHAGIFSRKDKQGRTYIELNVFDIVLSDGRSLRQEVNMGIKD